MFSYRLQAVELDYLTGGIQNPLFRFWDYNLLNVKY